MKDSPQPPVHRGLSLGWRLILSTALIIAVVMGGISVTQQLADIRKEKAIHQELLQISLAPLVVRLENAGTLKRMRELVDEFHEAHLGMGYPEHNVVLSDSAGSRVLSTLPSGTSTAAEDSLRAALPIRSPLLAGGQGTVTVLKSDEDYRAGVRRDWLMWLVHLISTVAAVSLFLGVATYYLVTKPVNRLVRGVRKMERGYRGAVDPGGAWEIRWLAWRFANMAREVQSSATRLSRAERKAWSLMRGRDGDRVSKGPPRPVACSSNVAQSTDAPEYQELAAVCDKLEAASPGDAEAVELARQVPGGFALEADRLEFHDLKARMEDSALRLVEPEAFASLAQRLDDLRANWGGWAQRQRGIMLEALERRGIPCAAILHRVKHTAGVRAKMHGKDLDLHEVHDLFAFRIIVPTEADCYAALGVMHRVYEAEVGRFKDYIAEPKENGYQGLHTCVQSEGAPLFEIQIRSVAMDRRAERGSAVHWHYKEDQHMFHDTPAKSAPWNRWWNAARRVVDR
jgi:hypothetical protein